MRYSRRDVIRSLMAASCMGLSYDQSDIQMLLRQGKKKPVDVGPKNPPVLVNTEYGPMAGVLKPSGFVDINPGTNLIQSAVTANPAGTGFWLKSGTHSVTSNIQPKNGDVFLGEYGAVLDGTGWSSADADAAAIRSISVGIVNVSVRNLEICNMPQNGVKARDYDMGTPVASTWLIEHCNIHHCGRNGVALGTNSVARRNILTYNGDGSTYGGNYEAYGSSGAIFEYNEISYGSNEQKIVGAANVVFRGNWVHHQRDGVGIWYDTAGTGGLIEDNVVEDNPYDGVMIEVTSNTTVRNNIIRRNGFSGGNGLYGSLCQYLDAYGNTIDSNFRQVTLFVNCDARTATGRDLENNSVHDNTIRVSSSPSGGQLASQMITHGSCADITPYTSGARNNNFTNNAYQIPTAMSASGLWTWGYVSSPQNWTQWQALPQDATGSRTLY